MSSFAIGDEVSLPQGHRAILRWIGRIPGKSPIEYAGVEVIGPAAERLGKHSGEHEGVQYFETKIPNTGLFVTYTQLVSANIRTPRIGTMSPPIGSTSVFLSPGLKTPSRDQRDFKDGFVRSPLAAKSPSNFQVQNFDENTHASSNDSIYLSLDTPSSSSASAQLEKMREQRDIERKKHEEQRTEYRQTLMSMNEKVEDLKKNFNKKIEGIKAEYEGKLRNARRTSSLMIQPGGSEMEEQKLALANMQNTLISERTEKQEEIDGLKSELENVRKLLGSADDLESLAGDLAKSEKQLKEIQSQVEEIDHLKEQVGELKSRNTYLELIVQKPNYQ